MGSWNPELILGVPMGVVALWRFDRSMCGFIFGRLTLTMGVRWGVCRDGDAGAGLLLLVLNMHYPFTVYVR